MGKKEIKIRETIINNELDIVYSEFNLGSLGIPRKEIKELRNKAEDFEEIMSMVSDRVLAETDMEEDENAFIDTLQTALYALYNMIYITEVYLTGGDFKELEGLEFEQVWSKLSVKDKEFIIASYLRLGDMLVVYYGVYILMNQVENNK